jgi:hypothetical protein
VNRLFDYAAWVRRAQKFVLARGGLPGFTVVANDVSHPLSRTQLDALARSLAQPLPGAFRLFLKFGAAALHCRYTLAWDPDDRAAKLAFRGLFPLAASISGGPCIGPADELHTFAQSCAEWGGVFHTNDDTDKAETWLDALPVIALGKDDYIALEGNTSRDPDDPPVLYLSHDKEDVQLADSFTSFLTTWERLCYIGPEPRLLDRFRDPDGGLLDADSREADQLRQLFGVPNVERDR